MVLEDIREEIVAEMGHAPEESLPEVAEVDPAGGEGDHDVVDAPSSHVASEDPRAVNDHPALKGGCSCSMASLASNCPDWLLFANYVKQSLQIIAGLARQHVK
jgi:hypothetical protein